MVFLMRQHLSIWQSTGDLMSHVILEEKLAKTVLEFIILQKWPEEKILEPLFKFIQPFYVPQGYLDAIFTDHSIPAALQAPIQASRALWVNFPNPENLTGTALEQAMLNSSKLKIKLTATNSPAPCPHCEVNILDKRENFTLNYTMKCKAGESRDRAIKHIRTLVESAETNLHLIDRYLNDDYIKQLACLLSGLKVKSIDIATGEKNRELVRVALNKIPIQNLNHVRPYNSRTMHDRYIQIDNKLEILLSSGFDGLFFSDKDFSYSVRVL